MKSLFVIALAIIFAGTTLPAQAHFVQDEQNAALKAKKKGEILPYARIKTRAERALKGRVVGQRLMRTNSGWVYEIRARQPDGRVVYGIFDAKNGRRIRNR